MDPEVIAAGGAPTALLLVLWHKLKIMEQRLNALARDVNRLIGRMEASK